MKKKTKRKSVQTTERDVPNPCRIEHLQKILDLMMFQSRMPANPFMDKNDAYEAAGCGPQASMYIFAH